MRPVTKKILYETFKSILITALSVCVLTSCNKEKPYVVTDPVSNIETTSATCGGKVLDDGNANIDARGICWSINHYPTVSDNSTSEGTGIGAFTSNLTGLSPNTVYYVRAYANNSKGTGYGDEVSFQTNELLRATVVTSPVSSYSTNYAVAGGNVTDDGGAEVTARGVCWNTLQNPTTSNFKTTDGKGKGSFNSTLSGLTPGQTYYYRAYAINNVGISYGEEINFTTKAPLTFPTVSTLQIVEITANSVKAGGNVTSDGGTEVTSRGVCWNSLPNPTVSNFKTINGGGLGTFSSNVTGLQQGMTYFLRAYAINSVGIAYGEIIDFTTLTVPTLSTMAITEITNVSAFGGGNIIFDGGTEILGRGVCWSTSPNPTTSNSKTDNGAGSGPFESHITGLSPLTTYYVRAYATNIVGTSYGNQVSFITKRCPESFTASHTEEGVAPVAKKITYGVIESNLSGENKCWITQNLGATNQAKSPTDDNTLARGWFWQFNKKQGYSHDGVTRTPATKWIGPPISENSDWLPANDPCLILLGRGWRIPTYTEWTNVDNSGGWNDYMNAFESPLKLHAAGALNYLGGSLWNAGTYGYYYSSSQYYQLPNPGGWYLVISYTSSQMANYSKAAANTLRCIKD